MELSEIMTLITGKIIKVEREIERERERERCLLLPSSLLTGSSGDGGC